ncbi:MAG: hypothetical protein LLF96_09875 [Eubacteriales bacterium]|nr:hypothetical protein [Eubacteriales bacterium]
MAVSWPFDSTLTQDTQGNPIYSRAYSSDILARFLARYFRNGVFGNDSTSFQIVAHNGMTVTVHPGFANINGRQVYEESDRVLTVQAAEANLDRIDTVVLRLDLSLSALNIDLYIVKGVAALTPVAPTLTRNASVYELGLANLMIAKNTTAVSQERITDTRLDSARCGVVACVLGDTDMTAFYAQIAAELAGFKAGREADFNAWFTGVQGILGEDEAGNLLNLINRYRAKVAAVSLPVSGWVASGAVYSQTLAVSIVPANCTLHAGPAEECREEYNAMDVHVFSASAGSVTFRASGLPAATLTANLSVAEVA